MQQTQDTKTNSPLDARIRDTLANLDFDGLLGGTLTGKATDEQVALFGLVDGLANMVAQMSIHHLTAIYAVNKDTEAAASAAQRLVDSFPNVNLPPYILQVCANQVQAVLDTIIQQHNDRIIASGEQDEASV